MKNNIDDIMNTHYYKNRKKRKISELKKLRKDIEKKYSSKSIEFIKEYNARSHYIINSERIKSRKRVIRMLYYLEK